MRLIFSNLVFLSFVLFLFGCKSQPDGFQLPGSEFYFKTAKFESPDVVAKAADIVLKREVLDNSPVLRDIERQVLHNRLALIYKRAAELLPADNSMATLKLYSDSEFSLSQILGRIGVKESERIQVEPLAPKDATTLALLTTATSTFSFTAKDIDTEHFTFQTLEYRKSLETAQIISGHISRRLLRKAADKKKKSLDEFIKSEIAPKVSVLDSDLSAHFKKIGFSEEEADEKMLERFRSSLRERKIALATQKYVIDNILSTPILIALEKPRAELVVNTDFEAIEGPEDAPISIVVFGSASCSDCKVAINDLQNILDEYEGYLRMNWIHSPQNLVDYDAFISKAALCIEEQLPQFSFAFFYGFADNAGQEDESVISEWVEDNDGDRTEFTSCLQSEKTTDLLLQHMNYSRGNGIVSNPTIWIEGIVLEGRITEDSLRQTIETYIRENNVSRFAAFVRKWKNRIVNFF